MRQLLRRSRRSSRHAPEEVTRLLTIIRDAERLVEEQTGMVVSARDVLEVGPGQLPRQMAYFALKNRVVGIDLDVIPQGWDAKAYLKLLRQNGAKRFLKTLARKALRFDAAFEREMARQLGVPTLPRPAVLQMDATRMTLPDRSFDFVYSFDVFEHFPDPGAVIEQVVRVLRPGGVCFTYLHPYTADDGSHDLRITPFGQRGGLPYWPHLRPAHRDDVRETAYLNKLRIAQWKELFARLMPHAGFRQWRFQEDRLSPQLAQLRAAGELADYSDDELLTDRLVVVWKKPDDAEPRR